MATRILDLEAAPGQPLEQLLPLAGERLLTDDSIHIAIIRGLVTSDFSSAMLHAHTEEEKAQVMNETIPGFSLLEGMVRRWWEVNGYRGYELEGPVNFTNPSPDKSISSHIDNPQRVRIGEGLKIFGGVSLSIAVGTSPDSFADFSAKRLKTSFKQPLSGAFNEVAYRQKGRQASRTRIFPATVRQYPGDGVLVTQHPIPSIHRVVSRNGRKSRVIDFPITPPFPGLQSNYPHRT